MERRIRVGKIVWSRGRTEGIVTLLVTSFLVVAGRPGYEQVGWSQTAEPQAGTSELTELAVDLFRDAPEYPDGYVRLGAWNVRHLKVRPDSASFFPGHDAETDAAAQLATFAKAIRDLHLDLVVLVEVQPRFGEPDRLEQLRELLNQSLTTSLTTAPWFRPAATALHTGPWRSAQTHLEYDDPEDPHGNLQFGLLWNTARNIWIDPTECQVLEELRQPQSAELGLLTREQRAPWLMPVQVRDGNERLEFDLLALHLKSGGTTPQAAEVEAISRFVRGHLETPTARHLIVCGDWNIRPDEESQGRGRARLRKLCGSPEGRPWLRLLTVGDIPPSLDEWAALDNRVGGVSTFPAIHRLLPYTHLAANQPGFDSLLDHIAISRSLEEVFDHPLRVGDRSARVDLLPGIEIATPQVSREEFLHFTDHLPVVLTLRVSGVRCRQDSASVRLMAAVPNPSGDERQAESVTLHNRGSKAVKLTGWRLQNANREAWDLDQLDTPADKGLLDRGGRLTIFRRGRPMQLNNSGDTVALFDSAGQLVDVWVFGPTGTGERRWRDP